MHDKITQAGVIRVPIGVLCCAEKEKKKKKRKIWSRSSEFRAQSDYGAVGGWTGKRKNNIIPE